MCAGHPSGTEMSCILVEHGARIGDNSIDGTRPLDLLPVSITGKIPAACTQPLYTEFIMMARLIILL